MNFPNKGGLVFWALIYFFVLAAPAISTAQGSSSASKFDGPAELPRIYMKTALADTPSPGKVRQVSRSSDLQSALDSVQCGETLDLQAGGVFVGHFHLANKACDDEHWITIRTSAPDDELPREGTRLTPCYAGEASLPGRPEFHCDSVKNVMAKIVFAGRGGDGPISFSDGANHYRLIGLEITREPSPASIVALASPDEAKPADHIIFDRLWLHGTAQGETRRGVFLSGTRYMAVIDSFFSDFHCIAKTGACTDSQAISGASGDLPMGPFKIVNNFLEAAGENVLFGGAKATTTPADIEIRHNYLFKPTTWMPGQPGFLGGADGMPFIVKNHFELKNAQRVLFEGNVMENAWGGFSQSGFSVLLTPKNQNNGPGHENLCPLCRVTDVTIRNCQIAHVAGGFQIANVPDNGVGTAAAGERYSIHDVVIEDIDGKKYNGFGSFLMLLSNAPTLRDVKIDHVTALSARVLLNVGVRGNHIENFVFTNNLIATNERQMTSTGGSDNCVVQPERRGPLSVFKDCFTSFTFTNNVIINGSGDWPRGNFLPGKMDSVGMRSDETGVGALRLCNSKEGFCKAASKYSAAGTDHKDIGADIDAVIAATARVTNGL